MSRRPLMPLVFGLATALLGAPAAPAAEPETMVDLLWVTPRGASGTPAPCMRLLAVEAPVDWMAGDAAAVVLTVGDAGEVTAARAAEAMLAQQTAVLHLRLGPDGRTAGCGAAPPEPAAELAEALDVLQRGDGAGLVVVIGIGAAGPVALVAATEAATDHPGAQASRLAAAVALGSQGPATFLAGAPPAAEERWSERAPHLCAALAPLAGSAAAGAACLEALARPRPTVASLRPRR